MQFSQAVRLLNFFRKATGCAWFASHPGHVYSEVFLGFPQSYKVNFETAPAIITRRFPSIRFPIHYSSSSKYSVRHTVVRYLEICSINIE
jgi:hypothetical protein